MFIYLAAQQHKRAEHEAQAAGQKQQIRPAIVHIDFTTRTWRICIENLPITMAAMRMSPSGIVIPKISEVSEETPETLM